MWIARSFAAGAVVCLVACGGGGQSGDNATTSTYSITASVQGLNSGGLMLLVNTAQVAVSSGATSVALASMLNSGTAYSITVQTQPIGETCSVTGGSGTVSTSNVTNVGVTCTASTFTNFTETIIYSFTGGDDGADPTTALTEGTDGYLYGTTSAAGANGSGGTVFKITAAGVLTVLHSFINDSFTDGSGPSGVIQGADGNFYGVTTYGGATGNGAVFKVTPTGTETIVYSFVNGLGDGFNPSGNLIQATNGSFYGTARNGGAYGNGAIFEITPSGQESVLYSFNASANDGYSPSSGVIQGSDGNLYGTTPGNGPDVNKSFGAVFKVTLSGQETLVYTFQGQTASDGRLPEAGLSQGGDGNFYGTTSEGGAGLSGTLFKLTPDGVETVLSNFNAGGSSSVNGYSPVASLIQASDGNLYGINNSGGAHNNDGTVFQVTPQGVTTLVYAFGANSGDGSNAQANLIQASDGNFYGTTHAGGAHGYGTIFKITPQ